MKYRQSFFALALHTLGSGSRGLGSLGLGLGSLAVGCGAGSVSPGNASGGGGASDAGQIEGVGGSSGSGSGSTLGGAVDSGVGGGTGGGNAVATGSYALPPPDHCTNQYYVEGCIRGDASSECGGVCEPPSAGHNEGKTGEPGYICPRFMLFADEMRQAALDDAATYGWASDGTSPFEYAVVGHDNDSAVLDDPAGASVCCQCYQLIPYLPDEAQVIENGASAVPLPKPLIVQAFNTGAKEKRSGISLYISGRLRSQWPRSRALKVITTASDPTEQRIVDRRRPASATPNKAPPGARFSRASELTRPSRLTRREAVADRGPAPVVAKEEAVVRGPAWGPAWRAASR